MHWRYFSATAEEKGLGKCAIRVGHKKTDYNIADPAWLLFFLAIVSGFSYTCLRVEGVVAFLLRH